MFLLAAAFLGSVLLVCFVSWMCFLSTSRSAKSRSAKLGVAMRGATVATVMSMYGAFVTMPPLTHRYGAVSALAGGIVVMLFVFFLRRKPESPRP